MPQQGEDSHTVTVDFSFVASPGFKAKLPILVIVAVLLAFSGLMLARANLSMADMFDVPRYEFNVAKLYSVSFILFIALFAITLALAIVYGYGISMGASVLLAAALALVALVMSVIIQGMLWPFLILAASAATASATGSTKPKLTVFSAWNASGNAMTVLLVLLFAYSVAMANANKDAYVDSLFAGAAEFAPQLQQQVVGMCGEAVLSAIDQNLNEQAIGEKIKSSIPRETMKANMLALCPPLSTMSAALQDSAVDLAYNQTAATASSMVASLKESIQAAMAANESAPPATAEEINATASAEQAAELRARVFEMPAAQALFDYLPLLVGLAVISTAYFTKFIIQPVASVVCAILAKF